MMRATVLCGACVAAFLAQSVFAQTPPAGPPPGGGKVREACAADVKKLCPDVPMGGGKIKQCLMDHADSVSAGCKQAMAAAKAAHEQQQQPPPKSQ
jgi:Cysteine rich repeat